MAEILSLTETIERGSKQKNLVSLVQEWLCVNGQRIKVDGDYGPATQIAITGFQKIAGAVQTGKADPSTFDKLVLPLKSMTQVSLTNKTDLLSAVVELALKYLAVHPVEVGGQNMGPWIRFFMDGNQGESWPWCAGFDTYVVKQASALTGIKTALPRTYSCDVLGAWARNNGKLVQGTSGNLSGVKPGHLFLVRKSQGDWQHTGIVIEMGAEHCVTVEGNTNDEGSREGYEVCRRIRSFNSLDFVTY